MYGELFGFHIQLRCLYYQANTDDQSCFPFEIFNITYNTVTTEKLDPLLIKIYSLDNTL